MTGVGTTHSLLDLDAELGGLLADPAEHDSVRIANLLLGYGEPRGLSELLRSICLNADQLERCASASLVHPLGFDRLELLGNRRFEVRLHIWWAGRAAAREDIHNHRFDFFSTVVHGEQHVYEFSVGEDGAMMASYAEEHDHRDQGYRFSPLGPVAVEPASFMVMTPGSVHFTASHVFHQVNAPGDRPAATLFLKIPVPRGGRATTVIVPPGTRPPERAPRRPLSPGDIRGRLQHLAEVLEAA
jgi:hypothetical protein